MFTYDALGRRTGKTVQGVTTNYLYDGLNTVQEKNGAVVTANLLTGLGIDEFLTRTDGGGTKALLPDGLGSTVALDDGTGTLPTQYTYEPFGYATNLGAASTNSYKYTGREDDGTGLYYYRARYYHPRLQRFLSEDPLGFDAGDVNLYAYVANNPTNETDPTGEFAIPLAACLRGMAQGALPNLLNSLAKRKPITIDWGDVAMDCLTGGLNKAFNAARAAGNAAKSAATRAAEIQGALNPRTQRSVTTAVTETSEGVRVVTSSEGRLRPAQRAALQPGEVAGAGSRGTHAEVNGVNAAREMGLTPTGVAPSRPACPSCTQSLGQAGVPIIGP